MISKLLQCYNALFTVFKTVFSFVGSKENNASLSFPASLFCPISCPADFILYIWQWLGGAVAAPEFVQEVSSKHRTISWLLSAPH